MNKIAYEIFQVDAFADRLFHGNPAAVIPWKGEWPSDRLMIQIAAENNLSETAFFRPTEKEGEFELRWFTPEVEVALCGHATLATAAVIFEYGSDLKIENRSILLFHSKSGVLEVEKENETLYLNFPSIPPSSLDVNQELLKCFSIKPQYLFQARDAVFVFEREEEVRELEPDFEAIKRIPFFAVIATAPSAPGKEYDFVSRFFAPAKGVPEDPVTGSAHCTLIPYWSKRLQKKNLSAFQVSKRGGHLICEDRGDRVRIGGGCVLYLKGNFFL
ncbi:phenazine biosynthesis protein, PhzF family [Leptospira inadai serovar Lyme str. 10]|uniref:Phenazine biosynthesis protein, PhzF family n=2 Tax=Leptospira inadai serovar Lyme TaxID=293084 RepID=V6HRY9_9LEPT|nr:PhzF family phenazine biosynthesis protein [Leptospira inadai]EQA35329.1 phenazine biosynthesis protein, PhzF family [Leptospira inadai serovar Lyme str. 10]PNV75410.1 PhzF family phenazine biosynthesis protein [Leptospira inadai serovar Lyme]